MPPVLASEGLAGVVHDEAAHADQTPAATPDVPDSVSVVNVGSAGAAGGDTVSVLMDVLAEQPLNSEHVTHTVRASDADDAAATHRLPPLHDGVAMLPQVARQGSRARASKSGVASVPQGPPSPVSRVGSESKLAKHGGLGRNEMKEILALALPALGSVVADPLMSLVDTGCVGQISSIQLAALGPNTAIFNFIFQVFTFLGVGTTALIARNSLLAQGISQKEKRRRRTEASRVLTNSLLLAVSCGLGCTLLLETLGPQMLSMLGADATMMPYAVEYLRVRALACPAVMIMCASQGACLGQQDAWTPLKIFAFAGVFNLVGDMYLILDAGWGIAGAAWATLVAQYIGAALFLCTLAVAGQKGKAVPLQWTGLPTLRALKPFLSVSGTLVMRTSFTMLSYSMITYFAMGLGMIAVATHQVALQVFWFLSYFPEPLSLTAQSLIARDMTQPTRVRRLARALLQIAAWMGLVLGTTAVAIYVGAPRIFTNDPAVIASLGSLTAQVFAAEMLCALVMVCDGVSIGSGDFGHLPRVNLIATLVTAGALYAMQAVDASLSGIWCGMGVFFLTRLLMHASHVRRNWDTSVFGAGPAPPKGDSGGLSPAAVPA